MPQPNPVGAFKTHAGYIRALAALCGYSHFTRDTTVMAQLADRVRQDTGYRNLKERREFDSHQLRRSLHAAWGSELLLAISGGYAPVELQGVSNTWVAIQTYYAAYHAFQALVVARGQARPTSHPATQRMFVDTWATSPRELLPWSLGAADGRYLNLPAGHTVLDVHPWSTLDYFSAVDLACKALRTTRDDFLHNEKKRERDRKLKARRKAWDDEEAGRIAGGKRPRKTPTFARPNLTAGEHRAVERRTRAFGLLDYLYRLRIKAQYEDSTLFIDGPEETAESVAVFEHLVQIVGSTALVHELFIERLVGRRVYAAIVDDWIAAQAAAPINPVATRRGIVLA